MPSRRHRYNYGRIWLLHAMVALFAAAEYTAEARDFSGGCDSSIENRVEDSPSFRACSALTGLRLGESLKKKDDLDPTRAKFCGSEACLAVFRQLQTLGGLSCLSPYSTTSFRLDQDAGGIACFGAAAFAPPTLPPTAPPPPLTPSPVLAPATTTTTSPTASEPVRAVTTDRSAASQASLMTNAPETSLQSATTTPRVETSGVAQKLPVQTVTNVDESQTHATTSSVVLWQLVVTSSLMAIVFGLACFVFYTRSTQRAADQQGEASPYIKQATSARDTRTRGLSTGSDWPIAAFSSHVVDSQSSSIATELIDCNDEIIHSSRIPFEKLVFGERISHGSFGEVYRGSYRSETVAVKMLLPAHRKSVRHIKNFLLEVKLLARLEHERIVHFIGVAWDSWSDLSVVMEFCAWGDLRTLLNEYETDGLHAPGFDAVKIKIALHVAHGLMYLHMLQPEVLHRDLKSRNVLLTQDLSAKITDFGVSRERSDATMTAGVGSCLWMAPEVMLGERYDDKADIFSFGVLLSEIDLHCLPYSHARASHSDGRRLPEMTIVQMVSMGILSVAFSEEERCAVAQLGRACVSLDPTKRPKASEVLHRLHRIHQGCVSPRRERPGAFV